MSALALASLDPSQVIFLQNLPKAELHAHLNGCIPLDCLQSLAKSQGSRDTATDALVRRGLDILQAGVQLDEVDDFFTLFPAIYAITSTPITIRTATAAVLASFLAEGPDGAPPQCTYLELRTTPRESAHLNREEYLCAVLEEVEKYPRSSVGLIVSIDRRMGIEVAQECVEIASRFRRQGRLVIGVDLCGPPLVGDMKAFRPVFMKAKEAGLGVTLHIAETSSNTSAETLELLSWDPKRLGHATYLDQNASEIVANEKMAIEICLSSNIITRSISTLADHHLHSWVARGHPLVICSDDTLPFQTTLLAEYALLLAQPPLGLGFSEDQVARIASLGLECRFL